MKKTMYHATSMDNLMSITDNGLLVDKCSMGIFMCDKPEDCLKFVYLHGLLDVLMLTIKIDEKDFEESFDHNEAFFKCKAYVTYKDIPTKDIVEYRQYDLRRKNS